MIKSFLKKGLALGLSLCLVLSSAVGCGSKDKVNGSKNGSGKKSSVSAEELMSGAFDKDKTSVDGTIEFDLSGEIDMVAMMAKAWGVTPEKFAELSGDDYTKEMTKMAFSGKIDVKSDKDTCYIKGTYALDANGEKEDGDVEEYLQISDEGSDVYVYDKENKEWGHSSIEDASSNSIDTLKDNVVKTDNFKSLDVVEKDKSYIVTGVIDYKKVMSATEKADISEVPSYDDFIKEIEGYGIKEADLPDLKVVMTFDKSKNLKSVELKVDVDKVNKIVSDMGKVNKVVLKCTFNSIDNKEFEIPADVIKNAVDNDDDYGYDDATDLGGDGSRFSEILGNSDDKPSDESMENNFGYTSNDSEFTTKMAVDWFDKEEITADDLIADVVYTSKFAKNSSNKDIIAVAAKMFNKYTTVEFLKYVINNYSNLTKIEKQAAAFIVTEGYEVEYYITDNLSDKDAAEFDKLCTEIDDEKSN